MIYVIDFDDTLFDRSGRFAKAAEKVGIVFKGKLYEKSKTHNIYDPKKHLKLIGKSKKEFLNVVKQSKRFLFPGIIKKLKKLGKRNKNPSLRSGTFLLRNKLILLSKGNLWFHKQKIKYSGIEKFFDEIYITDNKLKIFQEKIIPRYGQEKIIFIDDKKEELEQIKKIYAEIKTKNRL